MKSKRKNKIKVFGITRPIGTVSVKFLKMKFFLDVVYNCVEKKYLCGRL